MAAIEGIRGNGRRSALDAAERALISTLGRGDTAPFLGHHKLPPQVALQLRDEIRRGIGRIETRLRLLFTSGRRSPQPGSRKP
jgi:hypothetical protein